MHLKKLELFGFKSFADRTEIVFDQGVTCVVGPNGCGKSNISDAIRWVLGERSAKLLRGSKMEDVIFNGTDFRKPVDRVEVSLTVDNADRGLPIDYQEVTLTRRLYRSGESEYLINRTVCRLKDIQDLILDTGIGSNSYSMIEQGRIDYILNADAEERRFLIEEAAGISKYKVKKDEAIRKLERTEENRLRLNDILHEVRKNIQYAERQARRAERYKEEFEKLKKLEIQKAFLDLQQIHNEKEAQQSRHQNLQAQLQQVEGQMTAIRKNQESLGETAREIMERYRQAESQCYGIQSKIEQNQQQSKFNREKCVEMASRQGQIKQEGQELRERIHKGEEEVRLKKHELESLNRSREGALGQFTQAEETLQGLEQKLREIKTKLEDSKGEAFQAAAETSRLRNEYHRLAAFLETHHHQQQKQEAGAQRLRDEANQWKAKTKSQQVDLQNLTAQWETLSTRKTALALQVHTARESLEILKIEEDQTKRTLHQGETRLSMLQEMEQAVQTDDEVTLDFPENFGRRFVKTLREIFSLQPYSGWALNAIREALSKSLAPEIEIASQEVSRFRETLARKSSGIDQIDAELRQIGHQLEAIENELIETKVQKESLESVRQGMEERLGLFERELDLIGFESQEFQRHEKESLARESDLEKSLAAAEEKERHLRRLQESFVHDFNGFDLQKNEALHTFAERKAQYSNLEERSRLLAESLHIMTEHHERNTQRTQDLQHESDLLSQRQQQLVEEDAALETGQTTMRESRREADIAVEWVRQGKEGVEKELAEIQNEFRTATERQQELHQGRHQFEMKLMDLNYQEKTLSERLQQTYRLHLEELNAQDYVWEGQTADELTPRIAELKSKMESLGPVNLLAIEEYEELKQRYEFLMTQQKDLDEAREQLMETIRKINRTTKGLFEATFANVQTTFQEYYQTLFRGGQAQLVLVDETNPLESGIDIMVRPPGKKLQHISLLSGGEKALTAAALLFALFKIKPSPFCVLDEVDAPLDEANVDRFLTVLRTFLTSSQFIIVTHNRKTIAMGDCLYGVTMQEAGISKLVSVKISKDQMAANPVDLLSEKPLIEEKINA